MRDLMTPMEDAAIDRPSASRRRTSDERIRKAGFAIKHRPNNKEAVWERADKMDRPGVEFSQSAVVAILAQRNAV